MRNAFKRSIIAIALGLPVVAAGSSLSHEISHVNVASQSVEQNKETRDRDDNYLVVGEETKYKIYTPTPPLQDDENMMTFTFDIEALEAFTADDLANDITKLSIVFEEANTTYDDDAQIEYFNFGNSEALSTYDYFQVEFPDGATSGTSATVSFQTDKGLHLGTGEGEMVDPSFVYQENEFYQFRILWDEVDASEEQWTQPTQFLYGAEAPTFSFTTYEGYEQSVVKMDVGFSDELNNFYGDGMLDGVFSKLQISWGDHQNFDVLNNLSSTDLNDDEIHWEWSDSKATFYLFFDDLEEGDVLDIDVNYQLNAEVGSTVAGNPHYTTEFNQHTYKLPTVFLSEPTVVDLSGANGDIEDFTDVTLDLGLTWTDTSMPDGWNSFSTDWPSNGFVTEAEYHKVVQGVRINEISTPSGSIDPSTIDFTVSNTDDALTWSETDGDVYSKQLYFNDLDLSTDYEVSFAVDLYNPAMFGLDESSIITDTVEFSIPKKADQPQLEITSVVTEEDSFQTSDMWNQVVVSYRVNKPSQWSTNFYNLPVNEMFESLELVIMDSEDNVITTQEMVPKDVSTEEKTFISKDLNSNTMYKFKMVGKYNDTYERIFGLDVNEDNYLESNVVSADTRARVSLPTLTPDLTAHYEELENEINNKFTYGFTIDAPESWEFSSDKDSAFYLQNMIEDIYITNVYREGVDENPTTNDEQLYEKQFRIAEGEELSTDEVNLIEVNGYGNDGLQANTLYHGSLVMDLTTESSDPNTGWLTTDSDKVVYDFDIVTGEVDIAPIFTIDGYSTSQNVNTSNKHDATIDFSIDISGVDLSKEEFEGRVPSYGATTSVYLKQDGVTVRPAQTYTLDELISTMTYNPVTMKYSGSISYSGLSGNTWYEVSVANDSDPTNIEEIQDTSMEFLTNKNEILDGSQMSMTAENTETGNQNEITNTYDNVVLNLNTAQADYGDALSGNLKKVEILTVADELVASFTPSELASLNSTAGISLTLEGLLPDHTYTLSDYKLKVVNDEHSKAGFEKPLNELFGVETITTGKLTTPTIDEITITPFATGIRVNWKVSNLNNIDKADVKIYSYGADETEADAVQVGETISYDSVFDQETEDDWIDYYNFIDFESSTNYFATLDVTPISACESTAVIHSQTETIKTADPSIEARFAVDVTEGTESIMVEYSYTGNVEASTKVETVKLEVIDNAVSDETNQVVIFSESQDITQAAGSGYFLVDAETATEIFSNQDYTLNLTFTTEEASVGELDLSTIMSNIDEFNSIVHTLEKGNNFYDNFTVDYDNMTEETFSFSYDWHEKETTETEMKNVTSHYISIYDGEVAAEENLINTIDITDTSKDGESVPTKEQDLNGDGMWTLSNDPEQSEIDMGDVPIGPNSKFTLTSTTVYDTYFDTTRQQEYEVHTTEDISVTYANTEIATSSEFVDNDSIKIDVTLSDATAFFIASSNTINITVEKDGEDVGFTYDGIDYDENGLTLETYQIQELDNLVIDDTTKTATFSIQIDAVYTEYDDTVKINSSVKTQIGERFGGPEIVKNKVDQNETLWFKSSEMGVLERVTLDTFDSKGDYLYELDVETNYNISEFDDIFISEFGNSQSKSTEITVLNGGGKYNLEQYFGTVDDSNLYLWVDDSAVPEDAGFNDLTFLMGRYVSIDWTTIHNAEDTSKAGKAATTYDSFKIQGFTWIWPPMTVGEFFGLLFFWIFIIVLILALIAGTGAGGYYAYRYSFSNKRWYPIVDQIAKEKFAVFTDYADQFGWSHKFQEYEDIQEKSLDELREYALKMNIPITWDMTRDKLVQICSLLTEEEVEQYETFIDAEVDIRNYEVLERWREDVTQEHHYWIKHKMSLLLEKGILHDDDDRLKHLHSELEYIEKEKQLHAEREEIFAEIKDLVGEALDTNIELTSEFNLDPLTQFKQEMRAKDEEERIAREEDEAIQREIEEIEFKKAEAKRLAKEAKEKAKAEKEAAKAAALAAKEEVKRAESIEVTKERLELEFKRLVVDIELFNKRAEVEVKDADEYREVNDRLTKDRIKLKKESNDFKASQKKLAELHDDHQLSFGLKTLKKVKITIAHSKLDKFSDSLEPKTKQELFDVAKEYNLTVKASWTKEQLRTNIVQQLKERGDFDD